MGAKRTAKAQGPLFNDAVTLLDSLGVAGAGVFKGQLAWLIFQKRHFLKVSQVGVRIGDFLFNIGGPDGAALGQS